MYCDHCGKQIKDNAQFCRYCGTNLAGTTQTAPGQTRPAAQPQATPRPTPRPAPAPPRAAAPSAKPAAAPQANAFLPIIGAVVGGIPGIIVWALAASAGYIWSFIGLLIGGGICFGFQKLGGRFTSKRSIVLCIVIAALELLIAVYLSWAMAFFKVYRQNQVDVTLVQMVGQLYGILAANDALPKFFLDVLKSYLFGALGCFGLIKTLLKKSTSAGH